MLNINKIFKEFIAYIIILSGASFLIIYFIAKKKVTILLYHDPKKEIIEKHLKYLSSKYNFIELDTLVDSIYKKDWKKIPDYPLILTLDDGHKGN